MTGEWGSWSGNGLFSQDQAQNHTLVLAVWLLPFGNVKNNQTSMTKVYPSAEVETTADVLVTSFPIFQF